jgi:hypothetical protein
MQAALYVTVKYFIYWFFCMDRAYIHDKRFCDCNVDTPRIIHFGVRIHSAETAY